MTQLITRIQANSEYVEMLVKDAEKDYFKEMQLSEYIKKLQAHDTPLNLNNGRKKDVLLLDDNIIGAGQFCKVIHQKEHKRIVTFKNKSYNISFPNSIYFVFHDENKVREIEAYAYRKYEGKRTELFQYPFPNMLYNNSICMGSAPKELNSGNYLEVLEGIIFTQYTHSHVDHIKSFKDTTEYFKHLEKNPFPYDLLISLKKTLESVLRD